MPRYSKRKTKNTLRSHFVRTAPLSQMIGIFSFTTPLASSTQEFSTAINKNTA
jgi:hypothetical protein